MCISVNSSLCPGEELLSRRMCSQQCLDDWITTFVGDVSSGVDGRVVKAIV